MFARLPTVASASNLLGVAPISSSRVYLLEDVEARTIGQPKVEEDDVRRVGDDVLESGRARGSQDHAVLWGRKGEGYLLRQQLLIIVDEEDSRGSNAVAMLAMSSRLRHRDPAPTSIESVRASPTA